MQAQRILPLILNLCLKHTQSVAANLVFLIHVLQHHGRKRKRDSYG